MSCHVQYPYHCFSSYFWFLNFVVFLFVLHLLMLLLPASIFLCAFHSSPSVFVLMHSRYLQCWRTLFLLLFLTHAVYRCYLWDVRPWALSSTFLSSGPFVWVFPLSILRMVMSILQWDYYYYYYYYSLQVFHANVSLWSFTGVWVVASLQDSYKYFGRSQ